MIQEKLVAALEELQYLLCVESDQQIDAVVEKYEEVVYEKLVECCEVHSPKQRDHPQRAAAKRGKAGKKELWLREQKRELGQQRKAIARGNVVVSALKKKEVTRE